MQLIEQLRANLKRDRIRRYEIAARLGVAPNAMNKFWNHERRFDNGHLLGIMDLYPELTTYCYEYMVESGALINARRGALATAS